MKLALEEAKKGASGAPPNPLVGCVVLSKDGSFLSSGHHEKFGGPHAEVNALRGLTPEQLRGATVVVTLEPCAHEGKTPSCAKMLAELPLKKVVYGLVDPNPLVSGQGAEIVRAAGIEVEKFVGLQAELEESCEAFLWNFRRKRVFTSLKVASSLDGQVALKSGESKWITGEPAREKAHELRAAHDAVLTGVGTLLADDPRLDVRLPRLQKTVKAIVLDSRGRGFENWVSRSLAKAHAPENIFWVTGAESAKTAQAARFKDAGGRLLGVPLTSAGVLDLSKVFEGLWEAGLRSVLVEAGPKLTSEMLAGGHVQRLYLFQAPLIIGAGGGLPWSQDLSVPKLAAALRMHTPKVEFVGPDLLWSGRLTQA